MTVRGSFNPLPVPTRLFGGEGVWTYSRRHAERNFSTVKDIERAIQQQGYSLRAAPAASERLELWRQLGGLHPSAFAVPRILAGDWVSDRPLCIRCARGAAAQGHLPLVGNVCLKHRRWIGSGVQMDLRRYPAALAAERAFRTHLAHRRVLFDSPVMLVALSSAIAALDPAEFARREAATGIEHVEMLAYPEQVRFARLLTRPSLMRAATDPQTPGETRHELIQRAVAEVIPEENANEAWRAQTRIWHMVSKLTDARREAAVWQKAPGDSGVGHIRLVT